MEEKDAPQNPRKTWGRNVDRARIIAELTGLSEPESKRILQTASKQ